MDGFFVVNKPSGVTSHDVVARARRQLGTRKIGHTGTLDPLATGVLVLGVGSGTRLIEYLVGCDKDYEAELTFGATSDTFDAEGKFTPTVDAPEISREKFEKVLPEFVGEIEQIPPKFSAIKIDGQSAHARARAGEEIEMPVRRVQIFEIKPERFAWPRAQIFVRCGSGTYIRSLAHDLGQKLKTGAFLSRLHRTRVGKFSIQQAIRPESMLPEKLLPCEIALDFPRVNLLPTEAEKIRNGQRIPLPCRAGDAERVAAFADDRLVAILRCNHEKNLLEPEKVFVS